MAELVRPDGATIHYEVIGSGETLLCLGGWGSFCHGNTGGLPFGLTDRYRVVIMDYRGVGGSTDTPDVPATMDMYADDAIAILDAIGGRPTHLLGMVGIGACVTQCIAIRRPDLARSLVNTGAWCKMDALLAEHLRLFLEVHRTCGWATFQRMVCALSFEESYYLANAHRLVGPQGPWSEIRGRIDTHARFIDASLAHDVEAALGSVQTPAMILHAPLDIVCGPRTTLPIEAALPNARGASIEGAAHVMAGKAIRQRFSDLLFGFYGELD